MPELTQEQRAELRAKAEAATPGPWYATDGVVWAIVPVMGMGYDTGRNGEPIPIPVVEPSQERIADSSEQDAAYIAAADPQTVLALLDALEEAEQQRADWIAAWHTEHDVAVTARAVSRRQPYSAAQ